MWYKLWVKSSFGADDWKYVWLVKKDLKERPLKERVAEWVKGHRLMCHSGNILQSGYEKVEMGTDAELDKRIRDLLGRRLRLENKVDVLQAEYVRLCDVRSFLNHKEFDAAQKWKEKF